MKKKLTSEEIAHLAGVSRSTVSRVINNYSNVPERTRQRIMDIIEKYEYYPSISGQVLAGKKTGTLGLIWVSSGSISYDTLSSSYIVNITESAAELGYLVLTCIVQNLHDTENINWVKRLFLQSRIDAGIFIGTNNHEPLVEDLIAQGKIVGLFDHYHPDRLESNRISVNFERETGEKVIDYVCRMGHRRIAVIDGNINRYSSMCRHEGFLRGMQKHGIEMRGDWMRYGGVTESSGYTAAQALLHDCHSDMPSVICANNDSVAFGVYRALRESNLSIPYDVSVVGIDNHERGKTLSPPLTSFGFDFKALFHSLVSRTIDVVEQKEDVPPTEFIPSTLVERSSCFNLKSRA